MAFIPNLNLNVEDFKSVYKKKIQIWKIVAQSFHQWLKRSDFEEMNHYGKAILLKSLQIKSRYEENATDL